VDVPLPLFKPQAVAAGRLALCGLVSAKQTALGARGVALPEARTNGMRVAAKRLAAPLNLRSRARRQARGHLAAIPDAVALCAVAIETFERVCDVDRLYMQSCVTVLLAEPCCGVASFRVAITSEASSACSLFGRRCRPLELSSGHLNARLGTCHGISNSHRMRAHRKMVD